jgi:hypothetical protein
MDILEYLMKAEEPWVRYRTLVDLMGKDPHSLLALEAKRQMLSHPLIHGLISELQDWPGIVLNSHKSAGQFFHKLEFLAELGVNDQDEGIPAILAKVQLHSNEEGLFTLSTGIPVSHGGTGEIVRGWALCDAPILLFCIAKMKKDGLTLIRKGVDYLVSLQIEAGWPCAVGKELGDFRGPGKKSDLCPYANLVMLKLILLYEDLKGSKAAQRGTEGLLHCWENSLKLHPYIFYMGTDFRKLKLPFIWYDILHVAEVLSQFPDVQKDPRFLDMLAVIEAKADQNGMFLAESEWQAWKAWDFGQKKVPSPWMQFVIKRIQNRLNRG